ncbi:hypothetical protein LTR94_027523, partial [Friedmanniomyces endolithicus]
MVAMIGTSRGSLREAIVRLSAAGRLSVGPRGTTIAAPLAARWAEGTIAAPLGARIAADPGYGRDVLEVRQGLERQAAFHAARRALPADRDHIRRCFDAMIDSHGSGDAGDEAQADAAFHLAIARASHNAVLHSVMSSMFGLLRSSISDSLEKLYTVPRTFEQLSDQHRRLMETILAGDAEAARDASDAHIQFVETTIRGIDEERARQAKEQIVIISAPTDYREAARRRLPPFLFHYIDGGANAEHTLRRNVTDLADVALRQRVLRDVADLSLETELFGSRLAMPVALAPGGLTGMYARRGEVQAARAAAEIERQAQAERDAEAARQQARVVEGVAKGLDRLSHGQLAFRLNDPFAP